MQIDTSSLEKAIRKLTTNSRLLADADQQKTEIKGAY
jgi:hypothetical protein